MADQILDYHDYQSITGWSVSQVARMGCGKSVYESSLAFLDQE